MTPVQEIILNWQGREIRQVVKWDRIPLYCQECRHVGHSSDTCYANGQRVRPMKKDYKSYNVKAAPVELDGMADDVGLGFQAGGVGLEGSSKKAGNEEGRLGPLDSCFEMGPGSVDRGEVQGAEGFQVQGRRRGKLGSGAGDSVGQKGVMVGAEGVADGSVGVLAESSLVHASVNRFALLNDLPSDSAGCSLADLALKNKNNSRYMKSLPNGDFDPEAYEDEKDWENEEDLEGEGFLQQGHGADKRHAAMVLSR